jgi:general secretion pathway protein H
MPAFVRRAAGFTLLELVVVIAILALAAALVLPRLPSTGETDLKSSARRLAGAIRYLNDQAIATGTGYRMRLVPGEGTVEIQRMEAATDREKPGEPPKLEPFLQERLLADGVTVTDVVTGRMGRRAAGEIVLAFGQGGLRDYVAIHLKGGRDRQYTVRAYPSTGRVRVDEGYKEDTP